MNVNRAGLLLLAAWCLGGFNHLARAADALDELKAKRAETFEFVSAPEITREGDRVTVVFESKAACDATVAVEDAGGKIVRHLASGVLGENAPTPFQKGSLKQTVVWDGKDDTGKYVDDAESLFVRVALGLKPRFERALYHSAYKRFGRNPPLIAPAPEGVYVYEGDNVDSIKLYAHDGTYLRTVYPFPAAKLDAVKGLHWGPAPGDGARLPRKEGFFQSTFFSGGYNGGFDKASGYGNTAFTAIPNHYGWVEDAPDFPAAGAFAVRGDRIALAGVLGLNFLAADGSSGGAELHGGANPVRGLERLFQSNGTEVRVAPRSAALSPDGKYVYLTGYVWRDEGQFYGGRRWLPGVLRATYGTTEAPVLFVGSDNADRKNQGNSDDKLYAPVSVACDAQGGVYVADYGNNRVQVFTPEGKLRESIPVRSPVELAVHPATGELYVCSWLVKWDSTAEAAHDKARKVEAKVLRLGPAGDRKVLASWPLPLAGYRGVFDQYFDRGGLDYRAALDPWADPPALWVVPSPAVTSGNYGVKSYFWAQTGIKIYRFGDGKLELARDFGAEALKGTVRDAPASNGRQLLSVNPKTGKLYVLEGRIAADKAVEIDPATGAEKLYELPHGADEIAFDLDGLLYLRTATLITRFDAKTGREIPWDYGEERKGVGGGHGARAADVISGLVTPGWSQCEPASSQLGGFGISPKGHVVAHCWNGESFAAKAGRKDEKEMAQAGQKYTPKIYPGRQRWGEIHVWDRHGKLVYEDAAPGITLTDGMGMDAADNLYVLTNPAFTPGGQRLLNPKTETLIKFTPGKLKIITSGEEPVSGNEGTRVPVPLKGRLDGPTQIAGAHQAPAWVQGAEWMFGGAGFASGGDTTWNARCALDLYARSFAPEPGRFSVAVLDTAGNVITRVGRYGNIDDGGEDGGVALMHACYVGVDGGTRLFVSDAGNRRIASVKLGYHMEKRVSLKGEE